MTIPNDFANDSACDELRDRIRQSDIIERGTCDDGVGTGGDSCSGCSAGSSRREFLRDSLAVAFGALATLGLARDAAGMTFRYATGLTGGDTATYPIPERDGVTIDRSNEVILVRWASMAYAFALSCPHQNTALRWLDEAGRFQCPKHKSKYSPDGTFQSGRATRGMDRYSISSDGASIVVDLTMLHKQTDDEAAWAAASVQLA